MEIYRQQYIQPLFYAENIDTSCASLDYSSKVPVVLVLVLVLPAGVRHTNVKRYVTTVVGSREALPLFSSRRLYAVCCILVSPCSGRTVVVGDQVFRVRAPCGEERELIHSSVRRGGKTRTFCVRRC